MNPPCENDADGKKVVYYDGSCPMCSAIIKKIDASPQGEAFSMRDIKTEPLPQDFTQQDVEREMHVVDADGNIFKNAEAILKLAEEYSAWKGVVAIGRLPVVKQILPIGYNFVAANRHFLFGPASRIYWLKVVISLGFIFGLLLSPKLWISSRFYPLTPISNLLPSIPYPADWVLLLALLALLAATIAVSKPKPIIWVAVALVSLLVLLDQERLQPWAFQYAFMLATLGFFSWKFDDVEGKDATLNICRFIVASIYFWSGLQKLNMEFFHTGFPWMIAPIRQLFPSAVRPAFYAFGLLVPIIEMGIGIGLLTRTFRNLAIGLALAMCTFVLWTIGPFGHNWDNIVWPWNITLAVVVLILFTRTRAVSVRQIFSANRHAFHKVILVVFGFLPFMSFFNAWDSYLSWSLYSGTTNAADIYMSDRVKGRLPDYVQQLLQMDGRGRNVLPISAWSFAELNVPAYPETRIFKSIARSICKSANDPREVILAMTGRLSWFNRDQRQIFNCAQLNVAQTEARP